MSRVALLALVVAITFVIAGSRGAVAQAPKSGAVTPAAGHRHYVEPTDAQSKPSPTGALAPRLQNLGKYVFPVTTKSPQAQRFINQGINLAYAFNHAESGRAFREAERLDPNCAMAVWGQALVLGPNINATMDPADEPKARELAQKALTMKAQASARDQALIDALAERYSGKPDDRQARDKQYSEAMRKVHAKFPADLDVATLYVESVMNLRPWGYWMRDGEPHTGTAEAVQLIERVLARKRDHPGALHLYIHLVEANHPEKAEAVADRLLPLVPAAGHLVHMPAHIFQRVGRYADAMKSNQLAIAADEDYITQCRAQGLYPIGYYPHNLHFLWFAATFDGQGKVAIDAARKAASKVDPANLKQLPLLAAFKVVPYFALTRFGRWDEMLAEPDPGRENLYLYGIWLYNRGIASIAKGQLADADQALKTIQGLLNDPSLDTPLFSPNKALAVLRIAPEVLSGELAAARKQYDAAIAHLERAVRYEEALVYTEPSEWHYPPRHTLGAVLIEAGRAPEAETVYWEDLRRNPENGWALFGLLKALNAQAKIEDAKLIEARAKKAWARSDVKITGSRILR